MQATMNGSMTMAMPPAGQYAPPPGSPALVPPLGVDPSDVPWLADLVARQAVRLFDGRRLQRLTQAVSAGPNCVLHTAELALGPDTSPPTKVALKQYHRPADVIFEVHQLLITPPSQYTNPLLGIVQLGDQGLTCLVVPYHPLGNLRQYMADQRLNLTALHHMQIVHDIASGLEFLHQRGIQHLNLHSANVLISLDGMAVLTDFGRVNTRAEVGQPPKPTAELERVRSLAVVFLAPEVLVSNSYSSRSEIYALGMIMFELLVGRVAFEKDLSVPGLATKVMFGKQDEIPTGLSGSPGPAYEALIRDCWKLNPGQRPHLSELKTRLERLMEEYRQRTTVQQIQPWQQQGSIQPPQSLLQQIQPIPQLQPGFNQPLKAVSPVPLTGPGSGALVSTNIITTHVIIADSPRTAPPSAKEEPLLTTRIHSLPTEDSDKHPTKPVETWTIGRATAPSTALKRDAIPISSRALELSSVTFNDHTSNTIPLTTPVPFSASATPAVAGRLTVNGRDAAEQEQRTKSLAGSTRTMSNSSSGSGASWPMPPKTTQPPVQTGVAALNTPIAAAMMRASTLAPVQSSAPAPVAAPAPAPTSLTNNHIPSGAPTTTLTSASWPMPPPARSQTDSSFSRTMPTLSSTTVAPGLNPSFAPLTLESRSSPTNIPARTSSQPSLTMHPMDYTSPKTTVALTTAPSSMVNGQTVSSGPSLPPPLPSETPAKASHFNWRQQPRVLDEEETNRRIVPLAASMVQVVEAPGPNGVTHQHNTLLVANADSLGNGTDRQKQRYDRAKSMVAAIEEEFPSSAQQQQQQQHYQQTQQQLQQHQARNARESILVIPVFPEPPSTLHNRRLSNMDARFRNAGGRQASFPNDPYQATVNPRTGSFSSDDSASRNVRSTMGIVATAPTAAAARTLNGIMAPQDVHASGANGTGVATGPAVRNAYMPITSSEDVPMASISNDIYSAARNGDLEELKHYLNKALHRSLSAGSTGSRSGGQGGNADRRPIQRSLSSAAEILDEFEPIERLPVLCCAAVARKNRYQALNMVLKAGANVEGKEQRAGNTPLHLVCETATPAVAESVLVPPVRYRVDENGARVRDETGMHSAEAGMSQLSVLDLVAPSDDEADDLLGGDEEESEEKLYAALKKAEELDRQEEEAMERVKEDSESAFSITTNEEGLQTGVYASLLRPLPGSGAYYQMKNQILVKGGLEDQIRLLVLAGSPIDTPNLRGETPLLLLLRYHDSVSALATLLRLGADPTHLAPFGPGTMNGEVEVFVKSSTHASGGLSSSKSQKRSANKKPSKPKLFPNRQNPLVLHQQQLQQSGEDPNHILVMHGGALAHAAYHLRVDCVKYLLEHEIECSDPALVDQAIIACQHSVAAQVNPPLVALQKRILTLLERDWKGEMGARRRTRVAEKVLNKKRKPIRANVLLIALAVSTAANPLTNTNPSQSTLRVAPAVPTTTNGPMGASGSVLMPLSTTTKSRASTSIPTTHLYAIDGPEGTQIELISQRGFPGSNGGVGSKGHTHGGVGGAHEYLPSPTSPTEQIFAQEPPSGGGAGVGVDGKGIFQKFRNITKRT